MRWPATPRCSRARTPSRPPGRSWTRSCATGRRRSSTNPGPGARVRPTGWPLAPEDGWRRDESAGDRRGAAFAPRLPAPTSALAADERVGRRVVREPRFAGALELGRYPLGEHFAERHPPLIEGVDLPDHSLGEDDVLVKG